MDRTRFVIEAIGIMATAIVLISFLMKNEKNIRKINIIGATIFVIYGLAINSISVWSLNIILVLIHIQRLLEMGRK